MGSVLFGNTNHDVRRNAGTIQWNGSSESPTAPTKSSIHTSQNGSSGAKVYLYKSSLLSALTLTASLGLAGAGQGIK